jgi:hypothetical protein
MKSSTNAGFIYLKFDPDDWDNRAGGARAVISGIKTSIGVLTERNPDGYSYDSNNKEWSFRDTPKNRSTIENLKKYYLPSDPDQMGIFNAE